jgi:signal transduction histidine kinase
VNNLEASEANGDRALAELRDEIAELRASRRRLLLAADAERRGIERELHDGLQQQLVGLAANLELAAMSMQSDPEAATTLIAEMRSDLRQALEQTRALAHRTYPPLDAGGLVAALRFAAANADVPARIDVAVGTAVPTDFLGAVYFCCLNVFERNAGTAMTIRVGEQEGGLVLEIEADRELHLDPSAVLDRVEALDGTLSVQSEPGRPTVWSCLLPLP